jgi:hypothetical protein
MTRTCTCGSVKVSSWRWRRGVLVESGFHRFDGADCQPRRVEEEIDEAQRRYERGRRDDEPSWSDLSEQARGIWRHYVETSS